MPSIIPEVELAPEAVEQDREFYFDRVREICRRIQNKAPLTDDEIIILAVAAAQITLAKYTQPGQGNAEQTLDQIFSMLDRDDVHAAIISKMDKLLEGPRGCAREEAPGGAEIAEFASCKDPEEPAGR